MASKKTKPSTATSEKIEDQSVVEQNLVIFLQNILKHQIIPMNFMDLRDLIEEAPENLKLYEFIQKDYPGEEFLDFLKRFPDIFQINADESIQVQESCYCFENEPPTTYDEIDCPDIEEYISDQDSD